MSEGITTFRDRPDLEDEQPPGMSLLLQSNSSSGSNRSISSNTSFAHPGSTMPRSNPPGASIMDLNRSISSVSRYNSNGNVDLPAGSSMLNIQRSNSNQSNSSINDPPAGTSMMNLNRSISNQSTNSTPGTECLNTQTLPHHRPALLPGMSMIDNGDECHSAPVKTDSSTFNFNTHPRSSSTKAAGTSMLSINGNPSMSSVVSSDDGRAFQNIPMPGTSMLLSGRETPSSQRSASPESYTTALMGFIPAQPTDPAPIGQPVQGVTGHEQETEGLHQMERQESSSMEDWMFVDARLDGGDNDVLPILESMTKLFLNRK